MPNGVKKKREGSTIRVRSGSGNVFADLSVPNADLALVKAELVQRIRDLISVQQMTESKAAVALGLQTIQISSLLRGQVEDFTIDRLFQFLAELGQCVEISVSPRHGSESTRSVFVV